MIAKIKLKNLQDAIAKNYLPEQLLQYGIFIPGINSFSSNPPNSSSNDTNNTNLSNTIKNSDIEATSSKPQPAAPFEVDENLSRLKYTNKSVSPVMNPNQSSSTRMEPASTGKKHHIKTFQR